MKKFEVGKIYGTEAIKFEVIARTLKTVTVREIHHFGKVNERKTEPVKVKVNNWGDKEVFFKKCYEVEA